MVATVFYFQAASSTSDESANSDSAEKRSHPNSCEISS